MKATASAYCRIGVSINTLQELTEALTAIPQGRSDLEIARAAAHAETLVYRRLSDVRKAGARIMPFQSLIPEEVVFTIVEQGPNSLHFKMDKHMRTSSKGQESQESVYSFDIIITHPN